MPDSKIWKNCMMYNFSAEGAWTAPCVVRINEDEIRVEYEDNGPQAYRGPSEGLGHYRLFCPELNGHADLHMFNDETTLVGAWVEGQAEGMWRIELDDEASMQST